MPSYPELGRHTPPPPPYSSAQRNVSNTIATVEASLRSDPPPPPPPSLHSTRGTERSVPSDWMLEQTVAVEDNCLRHSSVNKPAPPVSFQLTSTQIPNSGQPIVYHARNHYREPISFAMPVEPNLVLDSHGRPIRSFEGLSSETRNDPAPHQRFVHDQGAERRSDHYPLATQSLNPSSLDRTVTSYATQPPPYALFVDDQQPRPISRSYPRTTIPSLAYATGLDAPASMDPSRTTYPPSTLPSPQAVTRRPPSSTVSTATTTPMGHHYAPAPRPVGPPSDRTSQGQEQWRRASQSNHRRSSVSVRFEPYKRRQSSIAVENAEAARLAGVAHKEPAKGTWTDSDVEMGEGGKGGHNREDDAGS